MRQERIDASQLELNEKVVSIKRVTKVVKGGRNMRSVSYTHLVYGIKVGTFSMIMHIVCVLVQLAVQRKTFNIWKFLQIPYVIIFGSFLNFFYYDVLTFELHSYVVKFAFVILAYLGLALFLGPLLLLNLVNMPSEAICVVLS